MSDEKTVIINYLREAFWDLCQVLPPAFAPTGTKDWHPVGIVLGEEWYLHPLAEAYVDPSKPVPSSGLMCMLGSTQTHDWINIEAICTLISIGREGRDPQLDEKLLGTFLTAVSMYDSTLLSQ